MMAIGVNIGSILYLENYDNTHMMVPSPPQTTAAVFNLWSFIFFNLLNPLSRVSLRLYI